MGCFRVFSRGRSADFHGVNFELDTDTKSLRLERDADPYMRAYVTAIESLVRLGAHEGCDHTPDAYMKAIASLSSSPPKSPAAKESTNG